MAVKLNTLLAEFCLSIADALCQAQKSLNKIVVGAAMASGSTAGVGDGDQPQSYYCSTSDTYFDSKEKLADHYKSDFHR